MVLAALMMIGGAGAVPRAQGVGTLVYVMHQEGWEWGTFELAGLALMHPDGSNQVRLTYDSTDSEPAWSPDGFSIAFSRSSDIYVIPATGGTPINLTNHPAGDGSPAWSPDGRRIAFASTRGGAPELYLMNADGSGVTRLTGDLAYGRVAWAPDGSRIAFTCVVEINNLDICAVTVAGATVTRLTTAPGPDFHAAWSPDGRTIAFATANYSYEAGQIALMNADGSGVRLLNPGLAAEYPSWSPDGARIAFEVTEYFDYPAGPFVYVAVMNADGSGAVTAAAARGGSADWRRATGNLPPVASFEAQCSGHTCTFNGASSVDPDGSIANYAWDFGDGTTGSGAAPSHLYATGTRATVTLTTTDDAGGTASVSHTVEPNLAPFPYGYVTCDIRTCVFNGSQSSDRDGTIANHVWSFGDGTSAAGANVTHTYSVPAIYEATLTVTDAEGASAASSYSLVASAAPIAAYTTTCVRLTCVFDGSASFDPDGTIASYEWGAGYGSGRILTYTFAGPGWGYLLLRVRDNLGLKNDLNKPLTVTTTLWPVPSFTSSCSHLGCVFDGSTSSASESTITRYHWEYGDGSASVNPSIVNHLYAAPGTYTVVLTVHDDMGAVAETRRNVTVTSVPAHVGDIDRVVSAQGPSWSTTVTMEIHGDNHLPLANARVTGRWSNGVFGECITSAAGRCAVQLEGLPKQTRSVSFSVASVSHATTYRPDQNHDPDGDSNGTTIVIKRP